MQASMAYVVGKVDEVVFIEWTGYDICLLLELCLIPCRSFVKRHRNTADTCLPVSTFQVAPRFFHDSAST